MKTTTSFLPRTSFSPLRSSFFLLPSFLLAFLSTSGCGRAPEAASARAAAPEAARVSTVTPERATVRRTTEQPGQVEPFEVAPIHAKLAGYVRSVNVDIGDRVKKGQVLAELDVPEVEAEFQQKSAAVELATADRALADAAVGVARSAVASAEAKAVEVKATTRRTEADLVRWQAEAGRIEQLTRESAVTGSLRDETRGKLESARAARDETAAKVHTSEAALAEAKAALHQAGAETAAADARVKVAAADARRAGALAGYARIISPFNGVITRRNVDIGHLTIPGGAAEPLFVVARADRVRVVVFVPENVAARVEPGDPAQVRFPALDGRIVAGKVARTSFALDPATRTLRAEIDLESLDGVLRPGLYAHATIIADESRDALTVPASAVVREPGKTFCVVAERGRARRQEVRVGLFDGVRVEVLAGLEPDEAVVAANADSLIDGQPVQAVPSEKPATPAPKP